jgi:hypothetical protein
MVSTTAGKLINAAAEELEVIDSGGTLTTNEQASAIDRLQRLIDSSNAMRPLIFSERLDALTLIPGQQSYSIGLDPAGGFTANFNVSRPVNIDRANLLLSSTVRRPLALWDEKEWARIRYQSAKGPPQGVYFDRGFSATGFGTLFFYMIPDQAYQWEMYSWAQNPNIASTADLINYPPGYADFWLYSLVVRMASMFGRQPSATHIELLREAKEALASLNCPSPELATDPALTGGGGTYNWLTGQSE